MKTTLTATTRAPRCSTPSSARVGVRAFVRAGVRVRVRSAACDMDSGHPSLLNRDIKLLKDDTVEIKPFEAVLKRLAAVRAPLESVV